jgi:hypothetical protein
MSQPQEEPKPLLDYLLLKYIDKKPLDLGKSQEREYPVSAVIDIYRELDTYWKDKMIEEVEKAVDFYEVSTLTMPKWAERDKYIKELKAKYNVS